MLEKWKTKNLNAIDGAQISSKGAYRKVVALWSHLSNPLDQSDNNRWKLSGSGITTKKSTFEIVGLLKDTLLDKKPEISFYCNNSSNVYKGILEGVFLADQYSFVKHEDKTFFLFFYIKFPVKHLSNGNLTNVRVEINSTSLPLDKYAYQYCDKFSARNLPCSFTQYLKSVGTEKNNKGVGKDTCRVFILKKGSPHQYCSFLLGT